MYSNLNNADFPGNPADKLNYSLEFYDDFEDVCINMANWLPCYVPNHEVTGILMPNYEIRKGNLALKITEDQASGCREYKEGFKCSAIQTGIYNPLPYDSIAMLKKAIGEEANIYPLKNPYMPQYGYFEIRARVLITESNNVFFRLSGYDHKLETTTEISLFEINGKKMGGRSVIMGCGIRRLQQEKPESDFFEMTLDLDVSRFHCYAAEWDDQQVKFYVDNKKTLQIDQSPDYPMQLVLGIFELAELGNDVIDRIYPKELIVDYVRGYSRIKM